MVELGALLFVLLCDNVVLNPIFCYEVKESFVASELKRDGSELKVVPLLVVDVLNVRSGLLE